MIRAIFSYFLNNSGGVNVIVRTINFGRMNIIAWRGCFAGSRQTVFLFESLRFSKMLGGGKGGPPEPRILARESS